MTDTAKLRIEIKEGLPERFKGKIFPELDEETKKLLGATYRSGRTHAKLPDTIIYIDTDSVREF